MTESLQSGMESQENPFAKEIPSEAEAVASERSSQHQIQTAADETAHVPERVTAEEKRMKNPKKVAAGKAGAAAKKAKQEKILKELEAAKKAFHPPAGETEKAILPHVTESDKQRAPSDASRGDWTPWIIGACLAGGILFYTKQSTGAKLAQIEPNLSAPLSASHQPVVVKQLDKRDPFHMD